MKAKISLALGNKSIVAPESKKIKQWFRRSIVLAKDLKAGHRIKESDLDFKRPGTGIAPGKISRIVGKITKKRLLRLNSFISGYILMNNFKKYMRSKFNYC